MSTPRATDPSSIRVGDLEIDRPALEIRRHGRRLDIAPQAVKVLLAMADHPGELVPRESLYQSIWPERDVDVDRGLNTLIRQLRIGLGDSASEPRYIRTYPRRGYRLLVQATAASATGMITAAASDIAPPPVDEAAPAGRSPRRRVPAIRRWLVGAALVLAATIALRLADRRPIGVVVSVDPAAILDSISAGRLASDLRQAAASALPRSAFVTGWSLPSTVDRASADAIGARLIVTAATTRIDDSARIELTAVRLPDADTVAWAVTPFVAATDGPALVAAAGERIGVLLATVVPGARATPFDRRVEPSTAGYLIGRHLLRSGSIEQRARAVDPLEEAAATNPTASVRAHLAEALFWARQFDRARQEAAAALATDSTEPHAVFMAGVLTHLVDWNWPAAESLLTRAAALTPGRPEYQAALAFVRATDGRGPEVLRVIHDTYRRDPVEATLVADIGEMALYAGDPDAAAEYCELATSLEQAPRSALQCAFEAHLGRSDSVRAASAAARIVTAAGGRLGPPLDPLDPAAARVVALRHRQAAAAETWDSTPGRGFAAASFLAAVGRHDAALSALGRAVRDRESMVVTAAVHPRFRSLRNDPRFQALVARIRSGAGAVATR